MELMVALVISGALAFFVIALYNRLVALRQRRQNAYADIDVQLKLRSDLVPNLVETVKGYATHENDVLTRVTNARAEAMKASGPQERAAAEGALGLALTNLMAVVENYPDLKANQHFQQLQTELSDIENKIAAARRFLNSATMEYNTAIEQFPTNIIAKTFHFERAAFFDVGEQQRAQLEEGVKVSFAKDTSNA